MAGGMNVTVTYSSISTYRSVKQAELCNEHILYKQWICKTYDWHCPTIKPTKKQERRRINKHNIESGYS